MSDIITHELDVVLKCICEAHKIAYDAKDKLLGRRCKLHKQLKYTYPTYDPKRLTRSIQDINENLKNVQDEHDKIVDELEKRKLSLSKKLSDLQNLEDLINALTCQIFELQREFNCNFEMLTLKKQRSTCGIIASDLEKMINNLCNTHEEVMLHIRGQRNELTKEYAIKAADMSATMEALKARYDKILGGLEEEQSNASGLELDEINRKILVLGKLYEDDVVLLSDLYKEGDKQEDSPGRALQVTASGHSIRLFDDGAIKDADTDSLKSTLTSVKGSIASEDVYYLKTTLGKPLSLALAEILEKQPREPINYLVHWLFKYCYNQEITDERKNEFEELRNQREMLERDFLEESDIFESLRKAQDRAIWKCVCVGGEYEEDICECSPNDKNYIYY